MSNPSTLDFFLLNRAHQVARLVHPETGNVQLPPQKTRSKLSADGQGFCQLLDRICEIAAHQSGESQSLSDPERACLVGFERELVRQRFSKEAQCKNLAVSLIRAIFADSAYFYGLKPLPQYTEVVAYELLFPSWLNLLTATMLPRSDTGKQRLADKAQAGLFQYLGQLRSGLSDDDEGYVVGLLTFVASRFDAPACEELLQRFVDLLARDGARMVSAIRSIEESGGNGRDFQKRLRQFLTVQYTLVPSLERACEIAYRRPAVRALPPGLVAHVTELTESPDPWPSYFAIAEPLCALIESEQILTIELARLLESQPSNAAQLLELIVQVDSADGGILSPQAQVCLAAMIQAESASEPENNGSALKDFARSIAHNFTGFSDETVAFFCRRFVADDSNRKLLLASSGSDSRRQQLSSFLLEQAGKIDDDARFLALVGCATAVSGSEQARAASAALHAIDAVVSNRSIGNRELSDLVEDLRSNAADAIELLASPLRAAGQKSSRLAALYLTLNEIAMTLEASGKADNFSVVRAKFVTLTRSGDE